MKTFKELKESLVLLEILSPSEKKKVDNWSKGDNSFSDHMYKDQHSHHDAKFELESPSDDSEHKPHIENHISKHGFKIKDYKKGIATDKYGRETSIGKALVKTKAPDELKNKFDNDPSRQQQQAGDDHHVVISRHPHHVAGMTSEGHEWQSSCMNFRGGMYNHHLKDDVKHGTHVAYLARKDDDEIKSPLARIALKKYTNIKDKNDHILRPETKTYGNAPDSFHHTVHRAIERHFPGRHDAIYKKNENVYNDGGEKNRYVIGKNAINDENIHTNDHSLQNAIVNHPDLKPHHIEKMLNGSLKGDFSNMSEDDNERKKYNNKRSLLGHPNVSSETLHNEYLKHHEKFKRDIINHPKLAEKTKQHILDKGLTVDKKHLMTSLNVRDRHFKKVLDSDDTETQNILHENPRFPKKLIDDVMNHKNKVMRRKIFREHKHLFSSHHIDKLYSETDKNDNDAMSEIARAPAMSKETTDHFLKNADPEIHHHLFTNNKHITGKFLEDWHRKTGKTPLSLLSHKKLPKKLVKEMIRNKDGKYDEDEIHPRMQAFQTDKLDKDDIHHIIKNAAPDNIHRSLLNHENFDDSHEEAMMKSSPEMAKNLLKRDNVKKENLGKLITHHEMERWTANEKIIKHKKFDGEVAKNVFNHLKESNPQKMAGLIQHLKDKLPSNSIHDYIKDKMVDNYDPNHAEHGNHLTTTLRLLNDNNNIKQETYEMLKNHPHDYLRKHAKRKLKELKDKDNENV